MPATATLKLSLGQAPVSTLDGIRIALVDLEDQRCPVDVQCVWAGFAKVTLEVQLPGAAAAVRVDAGTGGPAGTRIPGDAELGTYRLSLTALDPRPSQRAPVARSAYVASVQVARR